MKIEDGIQYLHDTVNFDLRHPFYEDTIELSEFLYKIISGKDQDSLISQYKERENEDQKAQRIGLTKTMTKYAAQQIMNFFGRVRRSDNRKKTINHTSENALQLIHNQEMSFHAGKSLEDYLFDTVMTLTFMDPNSYLLFERKDIRGIQGQIISTSTYPVMILSEQVLNHNYLDGDLEWIIISMKRNDIIRKEGRDGMQIENIERIDYYLYTAGFTIELKEVDKIEGIDIDDNQSVFVKSSDISTEEKYYIQTIYQTGSSIIPVHPIGSYFSQENPAIFTSPLEPAHEVFHDLINLKSEFDLTKALHTFLQKIQYAPPCDFENEFGHCQGGYIAGNVCPSCQGVGVEIHKTTQDVILVKWPESKDEWIPLKDVAHYIEMPEWLPKWQSEQIEVLLKRISLAVFGTEVFTAPSSGARTATEVYIEWEKVYDKLTPYASKISELYRKAIFHIAEYLELSNGLNVDHKFPYDFKFETITDLLLMLKSAKESGASFEVQDEIERRIMEKQYANSPEVINKISAKRKFMPFRGKTIEEINFILSNRADDDSDKILYESFEQIFSEISVEYPLFYLLPYERQNEIIKEKVDKKRVEIKFMSNLNSTMQEFMAMEESIDDSPDLEEDVANTENL